MQDTIHYDPTITCDSNLKFTEAIDCLKPMNRRSSYLGMVRRPINPNVTVLNNLCVNSLQIINSTFMGAASGVFGLHTAVRATPEYYTLIIGLLGFGPKRIDFVVPRRRLHPTLVLSLS